MRIVDERRKKREKGWWFELNLLLAVCLPIGCTHPRGESGKTLEYLDFEEGEIPQWRKTGEVRVRSEPTDDQPSRDNSKE